MEKDTIKDCLDLGMAAYLKIHGFKVVGRKGRKIYFNVPVAQEDEFNRLCISYSNSSYHEFDSALMSLKKLPDYMPEIV